MTTNDAARILGISERRVRVLCKQGRLGEKHGRNYWITEDSLRAYVNGKREKGKR